MGEDGITWLSLERMAQNKQDGEPLHVEALCVPVHKENLVSI